AQRRHQKVIEESPAPGFSNEVRLQIGKAAVTAASAVGYVGAGTVEFLVVPGGEFYFMEMNTRLQVEHPVTEMVTGLDLVEWQLRVAAGEPLPLRQDQLPQSGHAIEARIYAEDPQRDFMPGSGPIRHLALPPHVAFAVRARAGGDIAPVRVDSAVRPGDVVTTYYDAMIAKLIVWGSDRPQALSRLHEALRRTLIVGLANNVDFLLRLTASAEFSSGQVDTGLIGREMKHLTDAGDPFEPQAVAAALVFLLTEEARTQTADPWSNRDGWRLNGVAMRRLTLRAGSAQQQVTVEYHADGPWLDAGSWRAPLRIDASEGTALRIGLADRVLAADVVRDGDTLNVFTGARHRSYTLVDPLGTGGEADQDEDQLCAPMPGKIIAIHASQGDHVRRGQLLLVMEAMKMEHSILAPHDGVVDRVRYRVGDQVEEGALLVSLHEPGAEQPREAIAPESEP
ncbi:MAG TPA: biotin/lipoyl-containing protein, partial [Burkholderiaceae bacterium]